MRSSEGLGLNTDLVLPTNLIDNNLRDADIILLLVSADFISSNYCFDIEMGLALQMHSSAKATVVPVILRSVDWSEAPFSNLQALPKDALPISNWPQRDDAFTNIAIGIKEIIQ